MLMIDVDKLNSYLLVSLNLTKIIDDVNVIHAIQTPPYDVLCANPSFFCPQSKSFSKSKLKFGVSVLCPDTNIIKNP